MTHLQEVGLGYFAHMARAFRIGGRLLGAGFACLIHGFFPGLFTHTASRTIASLDDELAQLPASPAAPPALTPAEAEA
ncbi:MAG TPA: DUF6356 family protein [Allosphingosinicella sp.]|nr:DUF6356 family protein [Allosphingosinicella sp.]